MKHITPLSIITAIFLLAGCEMEDCKSPVSFQISYIDSGETIELNIDDKNKVVKNFPSEFYMSKTNRMYIVENYCSKTDSIHVNYRVNFKQDTFFVINIKEVKSVFLGTKRGGLPYVFFEYYSGGMREYKFDD